MCQRRSRREQRYEGLLLLLLAGVLQLFSSQGFSGGLPGCQARLLLPLEPGIEDAHGYGGTGNGWGHGEGSSGRALLQANSSAPSSAPGGPPTEDIGKKEGNGDSGGRSVAFFLTVTIGPAAFLFIVVVGLITARMRFTALKRRKESEFFWKRGMSDNENDQLARTTFAGLPSTTFAELEAACEEFTNVIGSSTDCIIFKGTRALDGMPIAVTKLQIPQNSWTPSKEIGFRRKAEDLARMNHENLVNLQSYCSSEHPFERMLVFEYASNGTLYEHLHGTRAAADHLDWASRMRIIMGAAYGLQYMHHELDPPCSHFKFDASHVFLTEDYAAKVADFGISSVSILSDNKSHSLGRRASFKKIVRGIGYSDWDRYRDRQTPFLESNIRSFGVFLLETISGRLPYTDTQGNLVDWAKDYISDPVMMRYLVDPSLKDYDKAELMAICDVVRRCILPKSKLPTMNEVVDMLCKPLHMSRELANKKSSPLLWAEKQLLSSMDRTSDDGSYSNFNSPRQRSPGSKGSTHTPWAESSPGPMSPDSQRAHNRKLSGSETTDNDTVITINNPFQKHPLGLDSGRYSPRVRPDMPTELELFSPQDAGSGEDPEAPLAAGACASHSDSTLREPYDMPPIRSQGSIGRSFRRVWTENATELSKLDLHSPRRRSSMTDINLGR